jgi:hypothetical protein
MTGQPYLEQARGNSLEKWLAVVAFLLVTATAAALLFPK